MLIATTYLLPALSSHQRDPDGEKSVWLQQSEVLLVHRKEHPMQKNVREADNGTKVGTRLLLV